jgi:undecaprenyl-phosphate 4-deoxy-4-formamido-L-arabinose transferase
LRKLLTHALNLVTGFSVLPLQLASFLGFGFTLFGFCLLLFVLYNYFVLGGRVPGFTFVVSTVALFSGAQLFAIGIIGEYLARAHFRLMDKPSYTVRQQTLAAKAEPAAEPNVTSLFRS